MLGINEIRLSQESMKAIVQNYFTTVMFTVGSCPEVKSVKTDGDTFVVKTEGVVDSHPETIDLSGASEAKIDL